MSTNIDANALLMACMDDLGRERQDELPLSDKVTRGPTFLPGKGTGVQHTPLKLKKKLSQGWKAKIDDGEAKQMEGLDFEESRPWAKQHNKVKQKPPVKPAAPRQSPDNSRLRKDQASQFVALQKKVFAAQVKPQSTKNETTIVSETSIHDQAQEYTLCQGHCKIVNGPGAELSLRANLKTNRGFLVVKPSCGEETVLDVLDLDHPIVHGTICTIPCRGASRYHLSFQKADEAQEFQRYLKGLQDSAAQIMKPTSKSPESTSSLVSKLMDDEEKTLTEMSKTQHTDTSQSQGSYIPDIVPTQTITPSQDINDQLVINLIDLNGIPSSQEFGAKPVYGGTFEDTASLLLDIIHTILNCIKDPISNETLQNVEETVFKNWKGMAPMEFEDDDDLREDMQQFLRSAINIKLKRDIRQRKMLNLTTQTVADLNEIALPKATDRIQYTPAEMLDCRACQEEITEPVGLESSRWAKPLNPAATAYEPSEIPNPEALQVVEKSQDAQLGKTLRPGLKAGLNGLSTSRWARKPAAFEGHFAGIERK